MDKFIESRSGLWWRWAPRIDCSHYEGHFTGFRLAFLWIFFCYYHFIELQEFLISHQMDSVQNSLLNNLYELTINMVSPASSDCQECLPHCGSLMCYLSPRNRKKCSLNCCNTYFCFLNFSDQVVKLVLVVIAAFFLCWSPHQLLMAHAIFSTDLQVRRSCAVVARLEKR